MEKINTLFLDITCPTTLSAPINGNDPECSNGNHYGTSCTFSCKDGFGLSSAAPITCDSVGDSSIGEWSSAEPTCIGKWSADLTN